ncbi:MAG: GMP reductase [Gammaproteobacteria bacterium]|nr:GMP reductase [Gammaproteobacteria bacterium]
MLIENEIKLDFKDVLIRPKRSTLTSRSEVDLIRKYYFKTANKSWEGIPIIAANMDHTGTMSVAKQLSQQKLMTAIYKFANQKEWQDLINEQPEVLNYTFISTGIKDEDYANLCILLEFLPIQFICIDVANGYSEYFSNFIAKVRDKFPDKIIMAGNVVTGEMTEQLILSGADIVKVGIGPGSVCTTRKKTGVGYPQLSAIIECSDAAHGLGGLVCGDGGCVVPGDVIKAFAAGADFVMLGGMLSGHDECSGEIFEKNGKQFKRFYGMSSAEAMHKYYGKVADYRSSEGKSVDVPYKGPVLATIGDILGGLRSACTYVGARKLKELSKCTTFIRVSQQLNDSFNHYE